MSNIPHRVEIALLLVRLDHVASVIIADNLSKAGWSWGCVSAAWIHTVERSGLQTLTATTESVSLCERMKS